MTEQYETPGAVVQHPIALENRRSPRIMMYLGATSRFARSYDTRGSNPLARSSFINACDDNSPSMAGIGIVAEARRRDSGNFWAVSARPDRCRHAELSRRHGADTTVLEWGKRLLCSQCGRRSGDGGEPTEQRQALRRIIAHGGAWQRKIGRPPLRTSRQLWMSLVMAYYDRQTSHRDRRHAVINTRTCPPTPRPTGARSSTRVPFFRHRSAACSGSDR